MRTDDDYLWGPFYAMLTKTRIMEKSKKIFLFYFCEGLKKKGIK